MQRTFVETSSFQRKVDKEGPGTLRLIQAELLRNLEAGQLIQGTGGLRKARIADPGRGKGKRGGYRVIYLDLPRVERTCLLALYDKDEKDDISPEEKRILRSLVVALKREVK
ncbi:MAG TPA: hypothetical protein DCM05_06280 [Elusimicrobia bacterium]|nr:hypothetical protein [Elusimicrobiota bacterium]